MASLIAENSYLVPDFRKEKYAEKDKLLLVVTDLENTSNEYYDAYLD